MVSVEFCVVWPPSSALTTFSSLHCYQGCTDRPFLFVLFPHFFFVMDEVKRRGRGGSKVKRSVLFAFFLLPYDQAPLKSNSTMCCRGQGRRGGEPLLLLLLVRLVWLPLRAAAQAAELLLRLFFPPLCPRVGGEKLELPLRHTETCCGSSKQQQLYLSP